MPNARQKLSVVRDRPNQWCAATSRTTAGNGENLPWQGGRLPSDHVAAAGHHRVGIVDAEPNAD